MINSRHWLVICLALVMVLALWHWVAASGPMEDTPDLADGRWVSLMSTAAECLAVTASRPDSVSAVVRLEWEGQIEEAFLVLSAAGSQGEHSIYVNGRCIGGAPVRPGGQPCRAKSSASALILTDFVPIPPDVLVRGENVIRLTNDADSGDGWTAADVHIEIRGVLNGPPVAALEDTHPALSRLDLAATGAVSGAVWLTSTYELAHGRVISQLISYQIPVGYTGNVSVPLIVGIHGYGGTGQGMRDNLAAEANNRGWLLAAPDMHGKDSINTGEYALGYIGAQHDIIDTIEYMVSEYEVDPVRTYIFGASMGGQIATLMAAKYPDVFAAATESKGFTDLADWYYELKALPGQGGAVTRIEYETGGPPSSADPFVGFVYQRRSAVEMPQNSRLIPLHMWHNEADELVPVHHAYDLADAINNWNPPTAVTVTTVVTAGCTDPYRHCYDPELDEVFDYMEGFVLRAQAPSSVTVLTDESKPYYCLNVVQTGGDHWSQVQASYDVTETTVTAMISDTHPLTVAFNLGPDPVVGRVIERPGMGLPATTYLVNGGGNYGLQDYTSGYLTTTLTATGQFTLTISAVAVEAAAYPAMVLARETTTSTIMATLEDHLGNPVPDGTVVRFDTSEGTFPNASATYTAATTGGMVTGTLTLQPAADLADIVISFGSIAASTSVDVIHPVLELLVTPSQMAVDSGQTITYTYRLTNTGDITLTAVTLVDDNGTPEDGVDDFTAWTDITLAAGEEKSEARVVTLTQTTTNTVVGIGRHPLGQETARYSTTVVVRPPCVKVYLPVVRRDG